MDIGRVEAMQGSRDGAPPANRRRYSTRRFFADLRPAMIFS